MARPRPLRDLMTSGQQPSAADELGEDLFAFLLEQALADDRTITPERLQRAEAGDTSAAAIVEIAEDVEVRDWLIRGAPVDLVAGTALSIDLSERPFPLTRANGPYRCSSCGTARVGDHVRMLDATGLLEHAGSPVGDDDFRWCPGCVRSLLD